MWNGSLGDETPDGDFEAEGFGLGGLVLPLERQELGAEPLKSSHLENLALFGDDKQSI